MMTQEGADTKEAVQKPMEVRIMQTALQTDAGQPAEQSSAKQWEVRGDPTHVHPGAE